MTCSRKFLSVLAGCAVLVFSSTKSQALDFTYSFVNTGGAGTTIGSVVTGRILGLQDNSFNFLGATVTFDSVSTGFDPGFSATSWTEAGIFQVVGGVLVSVNFSGDVAHESNPAANEVITIQTGNRDFVAYNNFTKYYYDGAAAATFTPLSTPSAAPDATSTLGLLVAGAVGLETLRRRQARA